MAKYTVNIQDIITQPPNIGESRELSRLGNLTTVEMQSMDLNNMRVDAMAAVIYVLIRRQHPRFTEAELNGLDWDDIEFVQTPSPAADGQPDPTKPPPASKPGGQKSSRRSATSGA